MRKRKHWFLSRTISPPPPTPCHQKKKKTRKNSRSIQATHLPGARTTRSSAAALILPGQWARMGFWAEVTGREVREDLSLRPPGRSQADPHSPPPGEEPASLHQALSWGPPCGRLGAAISPTGEERPEPWDSELQADGSNASCREESHACCLVRRAVLNGAKFPAVQHFSVYAAATVLPGDIFIFLPWTPFPFTPVSKLWGNNQRIQ